MAAMTTGRASCNASKAVPKRCAMSRACTLSPSAKVFRSAPALKNFSPWPVTTTAYTSRLRFRSPTSAVSSSSPSAVQVLADGLFKVMTATCPSILHSIMADSPLRFSFLEQIDDGREVLAAGAAGTPQLIELLRHGAHGHGLLGLPGGIRGKAEILQHEVGPESTRVASRRRHVVHHAGVRIIRVRAPAPSARGVDDSRKHLRVD